MLYAWLMGAHDPSDFACRWIPFASRYVLVASVLMRLSIEGFSHERFCAFRDFQGVWGATDNDRGTRRPARRLPHPRGTVRGREDPLFLFLFIIFCERPAWDCKNVRNQSFRIHRSQSHAAQKDSSLTEERADYACDDSLRRRRRHKKQETLR